MVTPVAIQLAPNQRTIDPDVIIKDLIDKGLIVFMDGLQIPSVVTESIMPNSMY